MARGASAMGRAGAPLRVSTSPTSAARFFGMASNALERAETQAICRGPGRSPGRSITNAALGVSKSGLPRRNTTRWSGDRAAPARLQEDKAACVDHRDCRQAARPALSHVQFCDRVLGRQSVRGAPGVEVPKDGRWQRTSRSERAARNPSPLESRKARAAERRQAQCSKSHFAKEMICENRPASPHAHYDLIARERKAMRTSLYDLSVSTFLQTVKSVEAFSTVRPPTFQTPVSIPIIS